VDSWRRRSLNQRIDQPEVREAVGRHHLGYPIQHGAAVELPETDDAVWPTSDLVFEAGEEP
jgi:hypothetical protein